VTHPYRTTSWAPDPDLRSDDGTALAFGVMAFAGAIELAIAVSHHAVAEMVFGAACVVAGLWLHHRER